MNSGTVFDPLVLRGDAFVRGQLQARLCPDQACAVRSAVHGRLDGLGAVLRAPWAVKYLADQWAFCRDHDAPGLAETRGLADGFGIAAETLFAYLHANVLADLATPAPLERDGCTAWAARRPGGDGAWVVKNRDYRGEHGALQRVFFHADPAWGQRTMACVGSLGSPGAFSSGINSDGLAVVDTQIDTHDHGVGWLRYFLMTHLLRHCGTVHGALESIAALPHAGGGSLVIGDATGAVAAVELGHRFQLRETPTATWIVRTNHYSDHSMAPEGLQRQGDAALQNSIDRHARVSAALRRLHGSLALAEIQALMAGHDLDGAAGPCRHADAGGSRTLSTVIYQTRIPSIVMSHGAPCQGPWHTLALSDAFG